MRTDGTTLTFFSNKSGSYRGWSIRRYGGHRTPLTAIPERTFLFNIVASFDGSAIYYGAQQTEANIWKVEAPKAVEK